MTMHRLFLQQGTYIQPTLKKSGRYGTLELINRVHPVLPIGLCCSRVACALARGTPCTRRKYNSTKTKTGQNNTHKTYMDNILDIYIIYIMEPNDTE